MKERQLQGPQLTPEIIKTAFTIECECGSKIFIEKIIIKKISALISPSGNEELVPMPIMVCDKCGKMPKIFDPNNLIPTELKTIK